MRSGWLGYWDFLKSLFIINIRLLYGMWRLTRLVQPVITVFGGARVMAGTQYALYSEELAYRLARDGFSIITGGGPGIMEAANKGAYEYIKQKPEKCKSGACQHSRCKRFLISMGIGVTGLNDGPLNHYLQDLIVMDHFFSRKWFLVRYASGFVIFPGGIGTFDELFEILTLAYTGNLQNAPIVLVGKEYWQPLIDWMYAYGVQEGFIMKKDAELISLVDSVEEAFAIIREKCYNCTMR